MTLKSTVSTRLLGAIPASSALANGSLSASLEKKYFVVVLAVAVAGDATEHGDGHGYRGGTCDGCRASHIKLRQEIIERNIVAILALLYIASRSFHEEQRSDIQHPSLGE